MIVKEYNIFEKGINAIVVTVGLLLLYLDCHYYESDSSNRNRSDSLPAYFYFYLHQKADYSSMHHLYYQLYYNGNQPILSDSDSHHQYLRPIIRHYVDAHHTQTSIYG